MMAPVKPITSVACLTVAMGIGVAMSSAGQGASAAGKAPAPPSSRLTFNKDIAPILFRHCAPCHRPGQAGPFSLLSHADVKKHAKDVVKVTEQRYMPPWLPEPGYGEFAGERRLTAGQIDLIRQWVTAGAVEGDRTDLAPLPPWTEGWQLGQPDLVVQMSRPYVLAPEGRDVYRNFVIPVPINAARYVRALEFHPGNRCVHHVRIKIDPTRQSRRRDDEDPEAGFGGMNVPAKFPPGHLLTWQPGKVSSRETEDLPWLLEKGSDLVVQMHLRRTGKPEPVQCTVGFYFTDKAPTQTPFLIGLISEIIDIPAGANDYTVKRGFTLPADVDLLALLPHAHYLGKEIHAAAALPDGRIHELLLIKNWDFNWQDEYRFRRPVFLPKGTTLTMQWTYDNSDANGRNPNQPPREVTYGPESTDEMSEVWFQVLPRNPKDLAALRREYQRTNSQETAAYFEDVLRRDPNNAHAHNELGKLLGPLGHEPEAFDHFQRALKLNPGLPEPHYYVGLILVRRERLPEAQSEFEKAIRLDPDYFKAFNGLGLVAQINGNLAAAEAHYRHALRINPDDPVAQDGLGRVAKAKAAREAK